MLTFEEGETVSFHFQQQPNYYLLGLELNTEFFILELQSVAPFLEISDHKNVDEENVTYQDFLHLKERFSDAVVLEGREAYARFLKIQEKTGITKHFGGLKPSLDFELLKEWFLQLVEETQALYQELGQEELNRLQDELVQKELEFMAQILKNKVGPYNKRAVKARIAYSKFAEWLKEEYLPMEGENGQLKGRQAPKYWTEKLILIGYMQEAGLFPKYEVASKLHDFLAHLLGTSPQVVKQAQRKAHSIMFTNPANDAQRRKWLEQLGWAQQQAQAIDLREVAQMVNQRMALITRSF